MQARLTLGLKSGPHRCGAVREMMTYSVICALGQSSSILRTCVDRPAIGGCGLLRRTERRFCN
jgi:hypothetical protein